MSLNKSQKAIETLKAKSLQLNEIQNVQQGNTWKAALKDSLISYLGNDSAIINRLEDLHFTKRVSSNSPNVISSTNVYDDSKKENFKNLISNAISQIETHGIFKNKTKGNILNSFNNAQLIGGLFVAATLIFGVGKFFGNLEKEREITETHNDIQLIKEKYQQAVEINQNLKREIESLKVKSK